MNDTALPGLKFLPRLREYVLHGRNVQRIADHDCEVIISGKSLSEFMDSAGEITKPVMAMTNEVIFSICDMNIEIGKNGMMNSGRYRGIISSIVQIPVRRCSLMKWTMKRIPFMHIMTGPGVRSSPDAVEELMKD